MGKIPAGNEAGYPKLQDSSLALNLPIGLRRMEANLFNRLQFGRTTDRFSQKNKVTIVKGGAPFFATLHELIDRARFSIHLQTYIFSADGTGVVVAEHLMTAARRGVQVYLMADGYA
ncbi:MAG: hypothetical protein M3Q06_14655, partial [Bacteroidota bacterium]|nr:hypothetical protein [Bacteroidota bacterium]